MKKKPKKDVLEMTYETYEACCRNAARGERREILRLLKRYAGGAGAGNPKLHGKTAEWILDWARKRIKSERGGR